MIKGINYSKYTATSEDDPAILEKIYAAAKEMGVII
jgi:hypothetical protein